MNAFLTSSLRLRGLPATLACLALGLAWPGVAAAQTNRTWSSTSTNPTWSVNTNWSGNTTPVANDSLFFASTTGTRSLTNDITAGTTFNGITFNSGAQAYTLSGNSITLGGNVVNNSSSSQTIALPLSLSGTRSFTNNTDTTITISGNISGAGGLIRDGTNSNNSIVNLTGTNTFAGDITVNAGVLQVSGNGVLGTSGTYAGKITLGGASTHNRMVFMSDANQTLTGNIVSTANDSIFFVQNGTGLTGSGTVTLAAANPLFTSRLIVGAASATNVSTLLLSNSNAIQNARLEPRSNNKIAFASGIGTFNVGSLADAGNIVLNDTAGNGITLSVGGNNRTELGNYTGVLSGLGGLTKVGSGTLTLTVAQTYTGTTTITAGQLSLSGGDNRLATTAPITITGGVLDLGSRGQTTSGTISFQGGTVQSGTLTSTGGAFDGQAGTVSAILAGSVGLSKTTSGTLTLSGVNTYSGTSALNAGLVTMSSTAALGTGTITFGGGTLQYTSSSTSADVSARIASSGSAIAVDTNGQSVTWASAIASSNAGGLTKLGSGTLTLSGANGYTGTTTISAGQLSLSGGDNRLATTAPLTITGGVLDLGSRGQTTSGAISFQGGTVQSGTLTSTGSAFDGQAGTVSAILAGSVGLTKTTSGVLTLSGADANTYSGTTTVSAGRLNLNKTAGVNAVAGNLAITGGAVSFGTNNQIADTAAVTMSGSTSVFNGTGQNAGFNLTETIGSLAVTGGVVNTGVGAITVTGTGTFDATNGYVEYVQNSGGIASFGGLSLIGMTGTTAIGSARTGFAVGASNNVSTLTVGAGGLSLDGSNLLLQSANAATQYARLILNGNVTTAGTVASSIMTPASQAGIGRVELSGTAGTVSRTFTTAANGADLSIAVPITNGSATTAGIEKAGAGVLTLSASNSFNGGSTVSVGTLRLGNANALGASTGALAVNGGTLDLGGFSVNVGALSGSAGAVITTANTAGTATLTSAVASGTSVFGGVIQNNGSGIVALTKSGTGVLTLSGAAANTYSGTTTVSAGRLNLNKTAGVNAVAGNLAITDAAVSFGANNQIADTAAVTMSGSTSVFNGSGFNAGALSNLAETIASLTVTGGIVNTGGGSAITVTNTGTFDASTGYVEYLQNSGATVSFGGLSLIGMTGTTAIGTARTGFALGGTGLTSLTVGAGGLSLDGSNLLLQSANAATQYGRLILNGNVTTAGSVASSIMTPAGQAGIGRVELSGTAGTVSRTFTTAAGGANLAIAVPITNGASGTAGIVKAGLGTLTLTATNTFTGAANVDVGTLAFDRVAALNSSSGIGIAGGSVLDYTGATSGTLSRNVTVSSSGTGTIRNSGGQALTLSGVLTKDGRVLRLTGGTFNVTGQIVGASANSDLLVDGTSTVTLSSANTYDGPTFVNQASTLIVGINNAIPNNSLVTLGNATSAGTLDLGTFTNAIGGLAFGVGGGTVRMAANQTASPQLSSTSALVLGSNASLDLTGMQTTAGNYRLISSTGLSGAFGSVTGLDSNYLLRYGTVNANEVSAQRKADQATTFTMTTGTVTRALVNTSVAVSGSLTNSTPTGGSNLTVALSTGGGLVVNGFGSGTNSVAPQQSTSVNGTILTGSTVGMRAWSVINTDNNSIQTTSTASGSLDIVNQRVFSVSNSGTINLGTFLRTAAVTGSTTISSSGLNATTANASLGAFGGTNTNGFSLGTLDSTAFNGGSALQEALYTLSGSAASAGAISGSFTSSVTAELGSIDPVSVALVGTAFDPAVASFLSGPTPETTFTINFGSVNEGDVVAAQNFSLFNLLQTAGYTADLALIGIVSGTGNTDVFSTNLSLFNSLAAGSSNSYQAFVNTANQGTFSNTWTLQFKSSNGGTAYSGDTTQSLTLTTNVIVVPEPGAIALAGLGIGIAAAAWARRRK